MILSSRPHNTLLPAVHRGIHGLGVSFAPNPNACQYALPGLIPTAGIPMCNPATGLPQGQTAPLPMPCGGLEPNQSGYADCVRAQEQLVAATDPRDAQSYAASANAMLASAHLSPAPVVVPATVNPPISGGTNNSTVASANTTYAGSPSAGTGVDVTPAATQGAGTLFGLSNTELLVIGGAAVLFFVLHGRR